MNWYQKNLKKHWKDTPTVRHLYHISPDRIGKLTPGLSVFHGVTGIYFSPTLKSSINDWMNYVATRRNSVTNSAAESPTP